MRFYTKAWYRLCAEVDDTDLFEAIPDKDYTQEDILALHEQLKEAYVEEARRIYDLPPEPPLDPNEDLSLEQLPDSLSSEIFALSKEERQHLRQQLEQMYQKETEAYQRKSLLLKHGRRSIQLRWQLHLKRTIRKTWNTL